MSNNNEVFVIREQGQEVWKVTLNGYVLPTTWNSKGAAKAGLAVEKRRAANRIIKQ